MNFAGVGVEQKCVVASRCFGSLLLGLVDLHHADDVIFIGIFLSYLIGVRTV